MGLIHRITRRPLSDFVDYLWLSESYVQPHAAEWVLPTGNMGLVLDLDERGRVGDVLSGARTRSFILDTSRPLNLIGVSFRPGGGFPFFDGPVGELQDRSIPLDILWGQKAETLRQQLLEARSATAQFIVLESFLAGQLCRRPLRHPAVRYAIEVFQNRANAISVGSVSACTGLSARRFIEVFRREVGMTPKVFCRLSRFRTVLNAIESTNNVDWTATALECGYFDQAHFIHDFRDFSGISPSAYIRHRTAGPNHVRIAG
jgi:AraC-like DNA-binding protein